MKVGCPARLVSSRSKRTFSEDWSTVSFHIQLKDGKDQGEERRFRLGTIGVVDLLQYLEGTMCVGFTADATFAVLELRTM
jgi:hypothetical protein